MGISILHSPPLSLDRYTILSVATFYNIMLLCSPHRNATPSTQGESDNPASERQPVTQVEETNQSRYKVVTTVLLASLLSMACHIEITSPLNAGFATCATSGGSLFYSLIIIIL